MDDVAVSNVAMAFLALAFGWAGLRKLHDRPAFAAVIVRLVPGLRVRAAHLSVAIPIAEIIGAICIAGLEARAGALIIGALLVVSTIAVVGGRGALSTGGCGCLWPGATTSVGALVLRNVGLLAAALVVLLETEPLGWSIATALAGLALLGSLLLVEAATAEISSPGVAEAGHSVG
ncbi:MAG: MauE/DoxX family redox-associated membrane protein [Solirubrobacteraceae bacterium]